MTQSGSGKVSLAVGTEKGIFTLVSDARRGHWDLSGPHLVGNEVYHVAPDPRDEGTLFAAANNAFWGPKLHISHDYGKTWDLSGGQPSFPEGGETTLKRLWHLEPGRAGEPDTWYAGVEPAALFVTRDAGASWQEVEGLRNHPTAKQWEPGFGGLCLHSIVLHPSDPMRMWVGISAAGVYGTQDGGKSWEPMNQGVRADFAPEKYPLFGQCTHKLLANPTKPETLYQQNHCGVYRSDSAGSQWEDISEGLPSRFGFVLGLDAQSPETLYVVPEDEALGEQIGGGRRFVSGAKFRVYRSRNAGSDWTALSKGLPQENAYLHMLREGMATDALNPLGIYLGTKTGQIYGSNDDGESWALLQEYLPPVLSVEALALS